MPGLLKSCCWGALKAFPLPLPPLYGGGVKSEMVDMSVLLRAALKTRPAAARLITPLDPPAVPSRPVCGLSRRLFVPPPAWAFTRFPTDPPCRMGRASFGPLAYALPGRPGGWRCWYSEPWPVFPWPSPPSVKTVLFIRIDMSKKIFSFENIRDVKKSRRNGGKEEGALIRGVRGLWQRVRMRCCPHRSWIVLRQPEDICRIIF